MILNFALFLTLFTVLFFLSRAFTKNLYYLFFRITKNKKHSVSLLTLFFLPGTIVHELSHLLMAELLRVKTGEISFRPEIRENNEVKLGSLKMAKTDPLRHSLVGLAPILVGITTISSILYFIFLPLVKKTFSFPFYPFNYQLLITNCLLLFCLCYLVFILSNTMFSSKKDLETILFPILIALILGVAFWLGGIKISLSQKTIIFLSNLFKNLNFSLLGAILIDLIFLGAVKILLKIKRL